MESIDKNLVFDIKHDVGDHVENYIEDVKILKKEIRKELTNVFIKKQEIHHVTLVFKNLENVNKLIRDIIEDVFDNNFYYIIRSDY